MHVLDAPGSRLDMCELKCLCAPCHAAHANTVQHWQLRDLIHVPDTSGSLYFVRGGATRRLHTKTGEVNVRGRVLRHHGCAWGRAYRCEVAGGPCRWKDERFTLLILSAMHVSAVGIMPKCMLK